MPMAIAAVGVLASVAGAGIGLIGSEQTAAAQSKMADAQQQIAQQQQSQLDLDAARQRRDIARQSIVARATAVNNATSQGAGYGASSGLAGGVAQISQEGGAGLLASNQNYQIGTNIYGLQGQIAGYQSDAYAGQGLSALGSGVAGFGSSIASNAGMFARVGSYMTGNQGWGGSVMGPR